MKTPVLVISDIQFHAYKAHSRLINGVNSRLLDQMDAWRQAVSLGRERGCRLLLVPGDVFEVRGSIKPSIFNRVTTLIVETLKQGFDIAVIPGNHDMEHLEAGESAVDSWDHLSVGSEARACKVFKAPGAADFGGYRVLGIPYMHDVEAFKETFKRISASESPDITMIHQGLDNFNTHDASPRTGLTAEWLEDNNTGIIVCGHYHWPGISTGGRVVNVGALVQHRFSDEGSERGCWVLESDGFKFFGIESPRFITVTRARRIGRECRGSIVRIRASSVREAERLRKKVEEAGALSVTVEIEKEFTSAHEKTVAITSPRAMLGEYLDIMEKYKHRKEDILKLFDRICLH